VCILLLWAFRIPSRTPRVAWPARGGPATGSSAFSIPKGFWFANSCAADFKITEAAATSGGGGIVSREFPVTRQHQVAAATSRGVGVDLREFPILWQHHVAAATSRIISMTINLPRLVKQRCPGE